MEPHEPPADPAATAAIGPSKKRQKWLDRPLGFFWNVFYRSRSSKARQLGFLAVISGAAGSVVVWVLNKRYGKTQDR